MVDWTDCRNSGVVRSLWTPRWSERSTVTGLPDEGQRTGMAWHSRQPESARRTDTGILWDPGVALIWLFSHAKWEAGGGQVARGDEQFLESIGRSKSTPRNPPFATTG